MHLFGGMLKKSGRMMNEMGEALPSIELNTHQQSRFPRLIDMTVTYICLDQCGTQIELNTLTPATATQIHGNRTDYTSCP